MARSKRLAAKMTTHRTRHRESRRNFALAKRVAEASELYAQGLKQVEIAAKQGVSQMQTSRDLRVAYEEMRAATVTAMVVWRDKAVDMVKTELQKVEKQETEAWAAWERSKLAATWTRKEQRPHRRAKGKRAPAPATVSVTTHTEGQVGDPRFLQVLDRCQERRTSLVRLACEVVGVLGPDRTPPGDGGGSGAAGPEINASPGDVLVIRVRRDGTTQERRATA